MLLKVSHTTEYMYDTPLLYALQRLRVTPKDSNGQKVLNWSIDLVGANKELVYQDHLDNIITLISCHGDNHIISVTVSGDVETEDTAGVVGPHDGYVPLWLYLRQTSLTAPGKNIRKLVRQISDEGDGRIALLHSIMNHLHRDVAYQVGATHAGTTAEEALTQKEGVCQDHSHLFLSVLRELDIPARYVSGYMLVEGQTEQAASHAWAEAHVEGLGWVGFDVANNQSPDNRYIRLATGLDFNDAKPVSGIRAGNSEESLAVSIQIEQ